MKNNDEKMKEILRSQLKEEAEETIAEVEADKSLKDISLPEDMDEKLQNMIQEYEDGQDVYERLSEKDKEALRIGREMQMLREMGEDSEGAEDVDGNSGNKRADDGGKKKTVRYRKKKKSRKIYVLVAVVAVLVLGMGMTSIGGAPFLTGLMEQVIGDRGIVQVDTEREDEGSVEVDTSSEEEAYDKIKKELGVDIVKLGYKPEKVEFLASDVDKKLGRISLIYVYKGSIIEYQVFVNYKEGSHGYDIEDKLVGEEEIKVSDVKIQIREYEIEKKGKEYVAQFEYNDAFYTLNAFMPKEEFKRILENLYFF